MKKLLISIVGPTAVGKTKIAVNLARWLGVEILSADSRQFYVEMNIGTAKPNTNELATAPHHFINSHSIKDYFSAGEYGRMARAKIEELHTKKNVAIVVGGSGLYLKAIWQGFDEIPRINSKIRYDLNKELGVKGLDCLLKELYQKDPTYYKYVDKKNHQRVIRALEVCRGTGCPFSEYRTKKIMTTSYNHLKIGLNISRDTLFEKIDQRLDQMIDKGLFEEVGNLYPYREYNALKTVGYTEIIDFIQGKHTREEVIRLMKRNSRRYAKRQLTWFKKEEDIHWFEPSEEKQIKELIEKIL